MKITIIGTTLLITMLLTSFSLILVRAQPQPHNADSMWVDPPSTVFDTTNASVGTLFNVTIWLNLTEAIYSYEVGLHYNRTLLQCTGAGFTAGATSAYCTGHTTVEAGPTIDAGALGNGSVLAGESCLGTDSIPGPKNASLIWVEFQILSVPASGSNLTSTFDITTEYPTNTFVLDPNFNSINFVTYDGNYLFIGPATIAPAPLSASISPNATSISLGQSVLFSSTISGGTPPYTAYQWYVNSTSVASATSSSWTYTPTATGSDTVYLNVTDSEPTIAESNSTTVQVSPTPPPTGAEIYVDPSKIINYSLVPSSTFDINITLASVSNLATCAFNLTYDPQVLNWITTEILQVQGEYPTVFSSTGPGSLWANLEYETPITADPPQPIVTIYFEVTAFGTSYLNLTDTNLLDSNGTPITHSVSNGLFSTLKHDIALTNITPVRTWAYQGSLLPINITTEDVGNFNETFNVTVYADSNPIGMFPVNLTPSDSNTTTFEWNTTSAQLYHNYTLSAQAGPVPQEFDTTNNFLTDGTVSVRFVGDVNGDGKVNVEDISIAAKVIGAYGPNFFGPGSPPSSNWNPDGPAADINGDNKIDVRDIVLISINFGKIFT